MDGGETDEEFLAAFEADAIPKAAFHHREHVRLAWSYLRRDGPAEATQRMREGIRRFAAVHGVPGLYHETLTHAYFFLIRERMAGSKGGDWDEFAGQNPDLLVWTDGILNRYYRETTLKSELARTVFVFPDKCCPSCGQDCPPGRD